MKKLLPIILLLMSLTLIGQNNHRERIKALKASFITEKLNLSEKEAQKFWPIYNEYDQKMSTIKYKEIRGIRKEIKANLSTLSDEKAIEYINTLNNAEKELLELRLAFFNKLSDIISPKKAILLKISEEEFKRKMLHEYKKSRKANGSK